MHDHTSQCRKTPHGAGMGAGESADCPGGELRVYFDGSCPLCTLEIGHYAKRAGSDRLAFVDVAEAGADTGADLTAAAALQRFHVRLPDGRLVSGARAFVAIWRELPAWRWAARLASLPGVTPLLEIAYRLFVPVRPSLSWLAGWLGLRSAAARDAHAR